MMGTLQPYLVSAFVDQILLAESAGEPVSRDCICELLRGVAYDGFDRSVDMRISTLRKKLKDDAPPHQLIKTIRGKGYLLVAD